MLEGPQNCKSEADVQALLEDSELSDMKHLDECELHVMGQRMLSDLYLEYQSGGEYEP